MKKEKVFILVATLIILIGIFATFIVTNSRKTPPEVLVKNVDNKIASALLGGYNWKVFGNNIVTDTIDLTEFNYSSNNTIVTKPSMELKISSTENFTVQEINYISNTSKDSFDVLYQMNDKGNSFTIESPDIEGTYICTFRLKFYDKGNAEYAVKVVVTDENVYDVKDIISYKDTKVKDILKIKEILNILPYSNQINKIMIDELSEDKTLLIKYSNLEVTREKFLNNTVALFSLIPDLDAVMYQLDKNEKDIYYSRNEINNLISKNVLEYADDVEMWMKEIIYKEKAEYNNNITIYSSAISSMLAKISDKEIGDYIAVDVTNPSGDAILNEYDVKTLLKEISSIYDTVLNIDSNEFENNKGTIVIVKVNAETENIYVVSIMVKTHNGKVLENTYKAIKDDKSVTLQDADEVITNTSGDDTNNTQSQITSGDLNNVSSGE